MKKKQQNTKTKKKLVWGREKRKSSYMKKERAKIVWETLQELFDLNEKENP